MRTKLGWGAAIVLCILIQGAIFGIGFLFGALFGENGSAHRHYLKEEGLITPVIDADPAFQEVEVLQGCDGSLSLGGEVETPVDLDRLQSQVIRALAESRSAEMLRPVQVKPVP